MSFWVGWCINSSLVLSNFLELTHSSDATYSRSFVDHQEQECRIIIFVTWQKLQREYIFRDLQSSCVFLRWLPYLISWFLQMSYWIRKSKDYVYGIWMCKALGIWKGYYKVKKSLVSYMKPWTWARNNKYMKYHSKLTYQLSFWNVSRKVDYQEASSSPLLIILSIACKWDPWQHVQSVILMWYIL